MTTTLGEENTSGFQNTTPPIGTPPPTFVVPEPEPEPVLAPEPAAPTLAAPAVVAAQPQQSEFMRRYQGLYGQEDFSRKAMRQLGRTQEQIAEEIATSQVNEELGAYAQRGLEVKPANIKARKEALIAEYGASMAGLTASQKSSAAASEAENDDPGFVGSGARIVGSTALKWGSGLLGLAGTGIDLSSRAVTEVGDRALGTEATEYGSNVVGRSAVAITDYLSGKLEGGAQYLALPQSARVSAQLDEIWRTSEDTDDAIARTAQALATGDGAWFAAENMANGASYVAGGAGAVRTGRKVVGNVLAKAEPGSKAAAATVAAGRAMSRVTGKGNITDIVVGGGVLMGRDGYRQTHKDIMAIDPAELTSLPDFQKFYDTASAAAGEDLPIAQAQERYAAHVGRRAGVITGVGSGLMMRIAPGTEAAFQRLITQRSLSNPVRGGFVRGVAIEAAAEAGEEAIQTSGTVAATNFGDGDGFDFQDERTAQAAFLGAVLGGGSRAAIGLAARNADTEALPEDVPTLGRYTDFVSRVDASRTTVDPDEAAVTLQAPVVDESVNIVDRTTGRADLDQPAGDTANAIPNPRGQTPAEPNTPVFETQARREAVEAESMRRRVEVAGTLGFIPSSNLVALYDVENRTEQQDQALAGAIEFEQGNSVRRTADRLGGATHTVRFGVKPAENTPLVDMSEGEARLYQSLAAGEITQSEFLSQFEEGDQDRALTMASRAETFEFRDPTLPDGSTDPAYVGDVSFENLEQVARLGTQLTDGDQRAMFFDIAQKDPGAKVKFGRGATHTASHPTEAYDVFYSGSDVAFAVDVAGGEVEFDDGSGWKSISEATPDQASDAVAAMAVSAYEADASLNDIALIGILTEKGGNGFAAVRQAEASIGSTTDLALQEFESLSVQAAADIDTQMREVQIAREAFMNSDQAIEVWEEQTAGLEGFALPPDLTNFSSQTAQQFFSRAYNKVVALADSLDNAFVGTSAASRSAKLRRYIAQQAITDQNDEVVTATGDPLINGFVRAVTQQQMTAAQRVSYIGEILRGEVTEFAGTQANPDPVSLRASAQATPQSFDRLTRIMSAVRTASIQQVRLNRVRDSMKRLPKGMTQEFGSSTLNAPAIQQGLSGFATPEQVQSATQSLSEALINTPGLDVYQTVPPTFDLEGADGILEDQADNIEAAEFVEPEQAVRLIEEAASAVVQSPHGRQTEDTLRALSAAASNLKSSIAMAPPPPVGVLKNRSATFATAARVRSGSAMRPTATFNMSAALNFTRPLTPDGPPQPLQDANAAIEADMRLVDEQAALLELLRLYPLGVNADYSNVATTDARLIPAMMDAAPALTRPEIAQVAADGLRMTPENLTERSTQAAAAQGRVTDEIDLRIEAALGTRADGTNDPFRLGERAVNPMARPELNEAVQTMRERFRRLGIDFAIHDSLEAYKEDELKNAFLGDQSVEVAEAIERQVRATPSFTARWVQGKGATRTGQVQIIADTFTDADQLSRAVNHELVAHYRLADLLGVQGYNNLRLTITNATKSRNPVAFAARNDAEKRIVDGVMAGYKGKMTRGQVLSRLRLNAPDLVASEALGTMAEYDAPAKSKAAMNFVRDKVLFPAGLAKRNDGDRWIQSLLKVSQDSLEGDNANTIVSSEVTNRLRRGIEEASATAVYSDNEPLYLGRIARAYRATINSEVDLQFIAQSVRSTFSDSTAGRLWDTVWQESNRANSISANEHQKSLRHIDDLNRVMDTMYSRFKGTRAQFDDQMGAFMRARDMKQRHRYLVLAKMETSDASFNEARAQIMSSARSAIGQYDGDIHAYIEQAQNTPAIANMLSELERLATDFEVDTVLKALEPASTSWEATVGASNADIESLVSGHAGTEMRKLVDETSGDELALDKVLDNLRRSILHHQIISGSYGLNGANLSIANGITDYVPQLGIVEDHDPSDLRRLFRHADPVYNVLTKLADPGMNPLAQPTDDSLWLNTPTPMPARIFNPALQGRASIPTMPVLKAFENRAYTAAYDVGNMQVHRAVLAATEATNEAAASSDAVTNLGKMAAVDRDISFSTKDGQDAFYKRLMSRDHMVVTNVTGDPVFVKINSKQLTDALTDRFITQRDIETNLVTRGIGATTRFIARSNTSHNPFFVAFRQYPRDIQESAYILGLEQDVGLAATTKAVAEMPLNLQRLGPYYMASAGDRVDLLNGYRKAPAKSWQREFAKMVDAGGEQLFTQQFDTDLNNPFGQDNDNVVRRTIGRVTDKGEQFAQRLEGLQNTHDNAVRFALYQAIKANKLSGDNRLSEKEATDAAVDVARNLMPFNRRSAMSRRVAPFFPFVNSAVASLSVNTERRIWKGGKWPIETVPGADGKASVRLREGWHNELNGRLAVALLSKGFLTAAAGMAAIAAQDDEDDPIPGRDRIPLSTYMDGVVAPMGGMVSSRTGEDLPVFVAEQLGITGILHATGAMVAGVTVGNYSAQEARIGMANAVAKNLTPLSLNFSEDKSVVESVVKAIIPVAGNLLVEYGIGKNHFGSEVRDFRDGETIQSDVPTTSSNPGLLNALAELERVTAIDRDIPGSDGGTVSQGISLDPGATEYVIQQFGVWGDLALAGLDSVGREVTGEPSDFTQSTLRGTGLFPSSPGNAPSRSFYRYKRQYLDTLDAQFAEAAQRDADNGQDGKKPAFSRKQTKNRGSEVGEFLSQITPEVWDAKEAAGKLRTQIGEIKRQVNTARRRGEGEVVDELRLEEQNLYREAVRTMRVAFEDGYVDRTY